jgi:hypothetical protein
MVGIQLAFDAHGNLTAAWSWVDAGECCGAPERTRFTVATKPAGRAWGEHVRVGRNYSYVGQFKLSVAPSGRAVVFWWQSREPEPYQFQYRFAVRVRTAAGARWGPVDTPSRFTASRNPDVDGDVVINNGGTGMAAWMVCRDVPHGQYRCVVRRSRPMRWGRWSNPRTMADDRLSGDTLELASTPAGFTVITWARPDQSTGSETVVALRTTSGIWSREVVAGLHGFLAVGLHGKVVMVKDISYPTSHPGLQITWRSNRFGWRTDTLAPPRMTVEPLVPAVDATGQIYVPWFNVRRTQSVMSTHLGTWRSIGLWTRLRYTHLAAAAVSRNGRAVAIRTLTNAQSTRTAVAMRVFSPG